MTNYWASDRNLIISFNLTICHEQSYGGLRVQSFNLCLCRVCRWHPAETLTVCHGKSQWKDWKEGGSIIKVNDATFAGIPNRHVIHCIIHPFLVPHLICKQSRKRLAESPPRSWLSWYQLWHNGLWRIGIHILYLLVMTNIAIGNGNLLNNQLIYP